MYAILIRRVYNFLVQLKESASQANTALYDSSKSIESFFRPNLMHNWYCLIVFHGGTYDSINDLWN